MTRPRLTEEQVIGIRCLLDNPSFAIFDSPGAGKSRMCIEAAEQLDLDNILVICPASVRISWLDNDFGELKRWANKYGYVVRKESSDLPLGWLAVSYEWARDHYRWLIEKLQGRKVMLIADESIRLKNPQAKTTKNLIKLSDAIGTRRVVLNGTPGSMLDVWGQYRFLGEDAVAPYISYYGQWRCHFSIWMQKPFPKLLKYINKDDFDALTAPRTLRRPKSSSLPPQRWSQVSVALDPKTWGFYKQMKQNMILWLESLPSVASNVGVQIMRLAQITSGFIGGAKADGPVSIGTEKQDWVLNWLDERMEEDKDFRCIVWCRFRHEIFRLKAAMKIPSFVIIGGQSEGERREAIAKFTTGTGPGILIGQPHSGGLGLNLVKAHNVVFLSQDYSRLTREQAEDRTHRKGQEFPVDYVDVLAEGPSGERTIDHIILKALQAKDDLYRWTASAWVDKLKKV